MINIIMHRPPTKQTSETKGIKVEFDDPDIDQQLDVLDPAALELNVISTPPCAGRGRQTTA